jgi:hypothetical protein
MPYILVGDYKLFGGMCRVHLYFYLDYEGRMMSRNVLIIISDTHYDYTEGNSIDDESLKITLLFGEAIVPVIVRKISYESMSDFEWLPK